MSGFIIQTNKPTIGEARQSGNSAVAAEVALPLYSWLTASAFGRVLL